MTRLIDNSLHLKVWRNHQRFSVDDIMQRVKRQSGTRKDAKEFIAMRR